MAARIDTGPSYAARWEDLRTKDVRRVTFDGAGESLNDSEDGELVGRSWDCHFSGFKGGVRFLGMRRRVEFEVWNS